MNYLLSLVAFLAAANAFAAGAGHGQEGIPTVVWYQVLNFGIYAAILFFVLRKPLSAFFKTRAENFRSALVKAEAAKEEAEKQKQEIEHRLAQLQGSADENIAKARNEAEELRKKIVAEAQELSKMLKEDAARTADFELQRAKTELREELLSQAITAAKAILSEKIAENDQKRLQTEFVEKIQVVRQ